MQALSFIIEAYCAIMIVGIGLILIGAGLGGLATLVERIVRRIARTTVVRTITRARITTVLAREFGRGW